MRRGIVSEGLFLAAAAAAAMLAIVAPAVATAEASRSFDVVTRADRLTLEADGVYHQLRLRLGAPDGSILERTESATTRLSVDAVDAEGQSLADGLYAYELRGRLAEREVLLGSGFFSIRDGAFVSPDRDEAPTELRRATAAAGPARVASADQVIAEDVIVQGSLCVGFDCVNNESFGFSTIRLKENNLRIELQDTSISPFPSTDWQIRANESTSGGASLFAVDELTAGTTPFSLLAGAPDNSLFVNGLGNVGLGTAVPVRKLHLTNGNTPTLRLEQDGSSGFTPHSWEIGGNEAIFFVRDVATFALPVRIEAGADTDSLRIDSSGAVGLGSSQPTERLDVAGNIAVSGTVDGRDVGDDGAALDAHLADHATAATKAGIVPAATFAGNPSTATVAFADPFPAGTVYAVLLTAVTGDGRSITTPNVFAKSETGFTITLGEKAKDLVEVGWLARPAGE